ncbi:uncharacterized protein G6M90_00g068230 [Metarhizium brunneum]|uniref:Uncharacterized protein n=1 Tax=Metarhizium brunneum TaxID=500148 RepID=A0A7D5Z0R3_9HYPO
MSASSHPSSSSAGEHGSTPKGPNKKRLWRLLSAQGRVTKAFKVERTREWIKQHFPSVQDQVMKPPEAEQKPEWIKQQRPSTQDQAMKPLEAKRKPEWIEQQPLSAQGQAANPPKAKRSFWEWVKPQRLPAQDQAAKPAEAKRNPEWVEQRLPSTLMATTLEKFLHDKHGDQYFVEMRFDQYTLFAPEPMTEAEIRLCERGYK